jgi:adenylate cyclase
MAEARVERRLAAILAADVAGYSRLMGADEVGTLAALKAHRREVVDPAIAQHHVKTTGDGMLVEFASAVDAVTCAVEVQEKMAERTAEGSGPRIQFRVGINIGDIIIDGETTFLGTGSMSQHGSRTSASRAACACQVVLSSKSEARLASHLMISAKDRSRT